MRFLTPPLVCALLLLLWSNPLLAQQPTTYSLEIHSKISEYGNTLGPVVGQTINDQWTNWQKVNYGAGDYHIRVDFLQGLNPKQYHRKKIARRQYIYEVKYATPRYDAIVVDKSGKTILQKNYGGEIVFQPFGADDQYASPDTLANSWHIHRETFYELEEAKYNNVNIMLEELSAIINDGANPIIESIETVVSKINVWEAITEETPDIVRAEVGEGEEEVVLAVSEIELQEEITNNKTTTPPASIPTAPKIQDKADQVITPQVPNKDLTPKEEKTMGSTPPVKTPTPYTNTAEPKVAETTSIPSAETKTAPQVDPDTGLVAGETPPVPTPQTRTEQSPEVEATTKPVETDEMREARLAKIQAEWDQMDKEDEEKNKKPRVRYVRLGLRMFAPIIAGGHGEVVLPILNNRVSIVGDFSRFNFGSVIDPFLQGNSGVDNIDVIYRYYTVGANFYFHKKYARGWYAGTSYLNTIVKTDFKANGENSLSGKLEGDAAALRIGVTTGKKTFMFGFEAGVGVPLGNMKGTFVSETDGIPETDIIDEPIYLVPILNITLGVAL